MSGLSSTLHMVAEAGTVKVAGGFGATPPFSGALSHPAAHLALGCSEDEEGYQPESVRKSSDHNFLPNIKKNVTMQHAWQPSKSWLNSTRLLQAAAPALSR